MSYQMTKTAQKQRMIHALRASEDFQKHAGWWDDFTGAIRSGANTAWDVAKFIGNDIKENPGTNALLLAGTLAGAGAPVWAARFGNLAHKGYKARQAYKAVRTAKSFKDYKKAQDALQVAQKGLKAAKGTPKALQAGFKNPVKVPGIKTPMNNPVAKTVAAPYRALRGTMGTFTNPTGGIHVGRQALPTAGRLRRAAQPVANLAGAGVVGLEGKNVWDAVTNTKNWANDTLLPVNAYNRMKQPKPPSPPQTGRAPVGPHSGKLGGPQRSMPKPNMSMPKPPKPPKLRPQTRVDWSQ